MFVHQHAGILRAVSVQENRNFNVAFTSYGSERTASSRVGKTIHNID